MAPPYVLNGTDGSGKYGHALCDSAQSFVGRCPEEALQTGLQWQDEFL
jgi:hypothetical protein